MEKNTKILIAIGAAVAAYLILKPKNAVAEAQTIVNKEPSKKLEIDSLERVTSPDDTPEMLIGATRRTYKDKSGVIYKYSWGSAYPPHGTYTDTNGNKWDDNGNPIIGNNVETNKVETELEKELSALKMSNFKQKIQCISPMAIGYDSYFDDNLGRCVTTRRNIPKLSQYEIDEARKKNIEDMVMTTDASGIIQNPYSNQNGRKFDDYVRSFDIKQEEVDAAKLKYPNSFLAKSNYQVPAYNPIYDPMALLKDGYVLY